MDPTISVQINAYDPSGVSSRATLDLQSRAVKRFALASAGQPARTILAPGPSVSLADWTHADVGWGLVAASTRTLPSSLKTLVKQRGAHVFRFYPEGERSFTFLLNEALNRDVAIAGSPRGTGPGRLPHYLMILGGPDEVPWGIQFALAATRAVGRLPLTGAALDNYVNALLSDFKIDAADPYTTVTWAVDTGPDDISHLMRTYIADKVQQKFLGDNEMGAARSTYLDGMDDPAQASAGRLVAALKAQRPGLIVSTSHGLTGPLNDVRRMKETLGLPVDQFGKAVEPADLLEEWKPGGAVWYCHACCSAGSESPSIFSSLFEEGSDLRRILDGIAKTGPSVAPLPLSLLGHSRPARAFIGHVEPTFDWTLRNPGNRQVVTGPIVDAIYPNLFQLAPRTPLGQAFRDVHGNIGGYLADWDNARRVYDSGGRNLGDLMAMQLCARDLQSLVILGDPAAMLPLRIPGG
jgi:hypothetical protein